VIARASADYMRREITDSWAWLRAEVGHVDADFFHRDPDDALMLRGGVRS
jgi:hypothetical protein